MSSERIQRWQRIQNKHSQKSINRLKDILLFADGTKDLKNDIVKIKFHPFLTEQNIILYIDNLNKQIIQRLNIEPNIYYDEVISIQYAWRIKTINDDIYLYIIKNDNEIYMDKIELIFTKLSVDEFIS